MSAAAATGKHLRRAGQEGRRIVHCIHRHRHRAGVAQCRHTVVADLVVEAVAAEEVGQRRVAAATGVAGVAGALPGRAAAIADRQRVSLAVDIVGKHCRGCDIERCIFVNRCRIIPRDRRRVARGGNGILLEGTHVAACVHVAVAIRGPQEVALVTCRAVGNVSAIDRRATGHQCSSWCEAAVVGQRIQHRIDASHIAGGIAGHGAAAFNQVVAERIQRARAGCRRCIGEDAVARADRTETAADRDRRATAGNGHAVQ